MGFLCTLLEVICEVLVGCGDQGLGQLVSVVHPVCSGPVAAVTVGFGKGSVDKPGVFECELLGDRGTTGFGIVLFAKAFEELGLADAALVT